jgi:hypothetical protein
VPLIRVAQERAGTGKRAARGARARDAHSTDGPSMDHVWPDFRRRPTGSTCRPMIAGTTSPGSIYASRTSRTPIGASCGVGTTPGGDRHVAAYLMEFDLTGFDPKAPPPKTAAFWAIADANQAPEASELADVLDKMGNPDVVTIAQVRDNAIGDFEAWICERKNRRAIPHRMETCGYVPVRNVDAPSDGLWVINAARQVNLCQEHPFER